MELLENEYIHIGTNKIYKELWENIHTSQTSTFPKPYGGLWCSKKNDEISEWLTYNKIEKPKIYNYLINKPACIIKFKNNSKLLKIDNTENFNNFIKSNLIFDYSKKPLIIDKYYYTYTINMLPNYEQISEQYDLLYINPELDNTFKSYSINTMLALKPDCIEYYKPIELDKEKNTILDIKEKEYIKEPNNEYYDYIKYIETLFYNIDDSNYERYIDKLNKLKTSIINNDINLKQIKDIDRKKLLQTVTTNIYIKKYKEKRKILQP